MSGRIASAESLHYAGDPAVSLSFEADPSTCASPSEASCLVYIDGFDSTVVVGGRYRALANDTGCTASGGTLALTRTPWIVPGFLQGTEVDLETGRRYTYECRDKLEPFATEAPNMSLAAANPVPDGRSRVRHLELVDGALVNQEYLYILFRESFDDAFLGGTSGEFGAYGLMFLRRTNVALEPADFEGNAQSDDRVARVPLSDAASCTTEILGQIGLDLEPANAEALAYALLEGEPSGGLDSTTTYAADQMHYLCHDTGLFDGGPMTDGARTACPAGSNVTYFYCAAGEPCDVDLRTLTCQTPVDDEGLPAGTCQATLDNWVADPAIEIVRDPFYRCTDGAYCDEDRRDLLQGKEFYKPSESGALIFLPLETAIERAFRYKTQFQDRESRNIGFAPEICVPGSNAVPYCYAPEDIEQIRDRVSCLAALFTDSSYYGALSAQAKTDIARYLRVDFSYEEESDPDLPTPIVHDGFERLYAELLIMLGDESFTSAFESRFDLAGASLLSFEGSLFEEDGIDLSGVAGYEMYTLYQAVEYYQLALDRFYGVLPYLWASMERGGSDDFVTQEMVTSYLGRVLRASTQRALAYSEIAKRYQRLNRADLARKVVERAYTSAYLESVVITRMLERIVADVATPTERPQLVAEIDRAATIYRVALLDMRELYGDLTEEVNYFGFAADYIPIPALDPEGPNAFEVLLARAERAVQVAAQREDLALQNNRSYETDAAAFQSELTNIRNTYEDQLAEICGTFEGEDGRVYPAIRRYAYLNERARGLGDPCGLMGNGGLHQALGNLELNRVDVEGVVRSYQENADLITIEEERMEGQCDSIRSLADIRMESGDQVNDLEQTIQRIHTAISTTERTLDLMANGFEIAKCDPPTTGLTVNPGNCIQAIAGASMFNGATAAAVGVRTAGDIGIGIAQNKINDIQLSLVADEAEAQCQQVQVDGLARVKTLVLDQLNLELEATRAEYRLRLTLADITRLRNQASRIEAQQEEAEQLAIHVEAARNDPNVRIYKNDAILNADISFENALREAYRATRVFEYYSSQSYPNDRLRDRPYVNTSWELVLNQRDETANQDINLQSLTDIRLYVYYTDFTAL